MHKYQWLENRLELLIQNQIQNGKDKLPSEQELCERYQISRQTVRTALNSLEEKGMIRKKRGSGSYITGKMAGSYGNEIGIFVADEQDYLYPGTIADIQKILSENGFLGTVFPTANHVGQERKILQGLVRQPLRGLIVEGCKSALPNPNLDLYRKLLKSGCPIVFLHNHYPAFPHCPFIKDNNFSGSAMLVRYLASQGHKAIAGIFKSDDLQGIERYQGFMETLRELEMVISDSRVCWYDSYRLEQLLLKKNSRFIEEMVQETLSSCTAVICNNDLFAYHLIHVLLRMGYSLPQDMAVASFDNTYLSSFDDFSITTLSHQLPHEAGIRAAEAILKKLRGLPVPSQELPWRLIQGKSSAQPVH